MWCSRTAAGPATAPSKNPCSPGRPFDRSIDGLVLRLFTRSFLLEQKRPPPPPALDPTPKLMVPASCQRRRVSCANSRSFSLRKRSRACLQYTVSFRHSGLIYEEVLHYHPQEAARLRPSPPLSASPAAPLAPPAGSNVSGATASSASTHHQEQQHRQHHHQQQQQRPRPTQPQQQQIPSSNYQRDENNNSNSNNNALPGPSAVRRTRSASMSAPAARAAAAAAVKRPAGAMAGAHQGPDQKRTRRQAIVEGGHGSGRRDASS